MDRVPYNRHSGAIRFDTYCIVQTMNQAMNEPALCIRMHHGMHPPCPVYCSRPSTQQSDLRHTSTRTSTPHTRFHMHMRAQQVSSRTFTSRSPHIVWLASTHCLTQSPTAPDLRTRSTIPVLPHLHQEHRPRGMAYCACAVHPKARHESARHERLHAVHAWCMHSLPLRAHPCMHSLPLLATPPGAPSSVTRWRCEPR